MKGRKLSWILVLFMLVNIIAGIQTVLPQEANAEVVDEAGMPGSEAGSPALVETTSAALEWKTSIFGNSTNTTDNTITVNPNGSITVASLNNKGKISSNADGIAYYYTQLDTGTPFQITADVFVDSIATGNSQISFGLMLRKTVGANGATAGHLSNFAAVGACNQNIQAFYRNNESNSPSVTAANLITTAATTGSAYTLKLINTEDNKCIVSCGANIAVINSADLFAGDKLNIGLFAARNAKVTFSNVNLITTASGIALTSPPARTEYFQGDNLDLSGMAVTATYSDGSTKLLGLNECAITGFNSNTVGAQNVTVYYAGRSATFAVNINALVLTGINLIYTPAKTTYYLNDPFDPLGMVVNANFSSGAVRALNPSEYAISGFDSTTPGKKTVTVASAADAEIHTSFDITVRPSVLQSLEITRQPSKTTYYLGETLNLSGLVVSAVYDDSRVMLQSGEYTSDSSGFNTATTGQKVVVFSHKGKTINLTLTVKAKELSGISVTTLPQTTFYAGDSFNYTGIAVSKVYDNGDMETLASGAYTIDSSAFAANSPGTYDIRIIPTDTGILPITYKVTVRESKPYQWNTVIFGQSSNLATNFVTPAIPGTVDGVTTITALTGGGKVTGAHDGISYYYTVLDAAKDNFVLSADIKVLAFAKDTPDNQEAFGIMARDAIGSYTTGTQPVFSSNVAAVGGYRGFTNAFMRTGVTNSAGNEGTVMSATNWTTQRPGPANTYPNAAYRLTLSKNNTGFTASLNGSTTTTSLFYVPDNFNSQDPDMYIGFYTARLATIEVSNVSFSVSDAATDAPRVLPPAVAITPGAIVTSLADVSKTSYVLKYLPNVNGMITIKQGETIIANDVTVTANQEFQQNTTVAAGGSTNFTITLTPDTSQFLTSYDKLVTNFTVTMKTYNTPDGSIYVSTAGTSSAAGTITDPVNLDTALKYVKDGQTIYMRGGTYDRNRAVIIAMDNDGTPSARKSLKAYNGETVILDFTSAGATISSTADLAGFLIGGNYWNIIGINVTNSNFTGLQVSGNNNIVERCTAYANKNTGIQISRFASNLTREYWPANNLILNCEAYDNRDPSDNNADGFAAKLTSGEGNVFRGCISHNNIDDGWDLYTKAETGPIGAVLIENCIAYNNGTMTDGSVGAGDKNGFKLGGEGIAVNHTIRNSIAFGNGANGFTSNSNPSGQAYNCTSFNNAGGNFVFTTVNTLTPQFVINNCISYRTAAGPNDSFPASALNAGNYFWNRTASVNGNGIALPNNYFVSLTPSLPYQRDTLGNIIWGNFLRHVSQDSSGDSDTPSTPSPTPTPSPSPTPSTTVGNGTPAATLPAPKVDSKGNATVTVTTQIIQGLIAKALADAGGVRTVGLIVPAVPGATAYSSILPASAFNATGLTQKVEVRTALGSVAIPGNMLSNAGLGTADVALSIAAVNKNTLSAEIQEKVGNRPVIELNVSSNGQNISYDNPDAPVTVSIPYKPTADELKDTEHIVVWYIDGTGAAIPVTDARYDAATGMVVFSTSHFSKYAVASVYKTFDDMTGFNWAKKSVEVLASKGIISGTSDKAFVPASNITRADFTVWLVKALHLTAKTDSNFSDVKPSDSFYKEVGTAKRLGIVNGTGNNTFKPGALISRQEMFVMTARALKLTQKLAAGGTGTDLDSFKDKALVSSYAVNDVASLVKGGLIQGSAGVINPRGNATRAEAASFLYRAYNK